MPHATPILDRGDHGQSNSGQLMRRGKGERANRVVARIIATSRDLNASHRFTAVLPISCARFLGQFVCFCLRVHESLSCEPSCRFSLTSSPTPTSRFATGFYSPSSLTRLSSYPSKSQNILAGYCPKISWFLPYDFRTVDGPSSSPLHRFACLCVLRPLTSTAGPVSLAAQICLSRRWLPTELR